MSSWQTKCVQVLRQINKDSGYPKGTSLGAAGMTCMNLIDNFLNQITMYRLTVYYLIALLLIAFIGSFFSLFSFSPFALIISTTLLIATSYIANRVIGFFVGVPTNTESFLITALILALIVTPAANYLGLPMLVLVSSLAVTSKFLLTYKNKHIFNPAAIAVLIMGLFFGQAASWWVGTTFMAPFVLIGGLLLVRKIQREDLVISFSIGVLLITLFFAIQGNNTNILDLLSRILFHSSFLFLAFVMLTEPLTTPPTKKLQTIYGVLVGLLFSPHIALGSLDMTPEMALCIGNIFSFCVSPKLRLKLFLKQAISYGSDTVDYVFTLAKPITFTPGQYVEWTLPHSPTDDRGNRRYFTIASSPTESDMHLGVKFYEDGSSYKKALKVLDSKTPILIGSLGGDFVLPQDQTKKLVFLAGGIGITPYRSMLKYLLDTKEKRDIIQFYSNRTAEEIAYKDVFDDAAKQGMPTIYTITDETTLPTNWTGEKGRITAEMIKKYVPDYMSRYYYLSGSHAMVTAYEQLIKDMKIPHAQIKKDFFPGFV